MTEVRIQSFSSVHGKIDSRLRERAKTGSASSLSAMYRHIKNSPGISYFSDYMKLAELVIYLRNKGIEYNREQIRRAMNCSDEIKSEDGETRSAALNHLCALSQVPIDSVTESGRGLKQGMMG